VRALAQSPDPERRKLSDPFGAFRQECTEVLRTGYSALRKTVGSSFPDIDVASTLEDPPDPGFGELASSISFELSRVQKTKPMEIAIELAAASQLKQYPLVRSVEAAEPGYVNFRANYPQLAELTLRRVLEQGSHYGLLQTDQPRRVIVEHTSANPARPIHIGTAKGAIFGDILARLLNARGHQARTRFYIDDTGRQVAIMAYGYRLLGEPKPQGKPDHFIGKIYSITSALVEIEELKKRLGLLKKTGGSDLDIVAVTKSLDEWVGVAADLRSKHQSEFDQLSDRVAKDPDPEASVRELLRKYEKADAETRVIVRRVTQMVMMGHEETLRRGNILFDEWDWESDLVWSGRVAELIDRLKETGFLSNKSGAWELDVARAVETFNLKERFGVTRTFEVPSLTLTRSDGTSLYATRDMAYSLYKFEKAERVINVIGVEQSLAQFQLRVALWILGHRKEALNYLHYPIGLVELEGQRMSARRGRYFTFDQVLEEADLRARAEVEKRSPELPAEVKERVAERIAVSAVRYAMLSVESAKSTNFVWDRALSFETNSAPFINYAYTRGLGILRKIGKFTPPSGFSLLSTRAEQLLILQLSKFPETFTKAADELDPTLMCLYANELAQRFHEFYEKADISHLEDEELKRQRTALVVAVRTVLGTVAELLGLKLAHRM
jgi:arginyl-tRNA synthetase